MDIHVIDTVVRVRQQHQAGQLARLTQAVAELGALIGEITTVRETENAIVRDVVVATTDDPAPLRAISPRSCARPISSSPRPASRASSGRSTFARDRSSSRCRIPRRRSLPSEARAAGAAFAGDGRSINNALAFPGIFRGALQTRSRTISPTMLTAAAEAIASLAPEGEVVPSPLNSEVHAAVARAVAEEAERAGLAGTARL